MNRNINPFYNINDKSRFTEEQYIKIIEKENSENNKNSDDLISFSKDEISLINYNSINKSKEIFWFILNL